MTVLIIISNHLFDKKWSDNIKILNDYMKMSDHKVDYCGISNQDDFHNYEDIIQFKYKIINTKEQLNKICDFITDYKLKLDYDWYIKIRPEIKLIENIPFAMLSENAINSRARVYNGPSRIKYGMSINGEGRWKNIGDCFYAEHEHDIVLDDMFYIFHKNIIQMNAFNRIDYPHMQNEWGHTELFKNRVIPLNIIGIHLCFTKYNTYSGDININSQMSEE
jgi:hypothetical protein